MKFRYNYIAILLNLITNIKLLLFKIFFVSKFCYGKGLEIGPGSKPFLLNNKKRSIDFIDKFIEKKNLNIIGKDASLINQKDETYDFLISSHCLEHCHNTILTLKEWKRVLKKNGKLILILPNIKKIFDNGRTISTLEHHIEDYKNNVDIYDKTHDREFYDISLKKIKHPWTLEYKNKSFLNIDFNKIKDEGLFHYHAWNANEIVRVLQYLNFKILLLHDIMPGRSDSFFLISEK